MGEWGGAGTGQERLGGGTEILESFILRLRGAGAGGAQPLLCTPLVSQVIHENICIKLFKK